jgi:putative sterol carrier protein
MTTAQEKMELAKHRLSTNTDRLKTIGAVYKFVLEGEGGGTWIVALKGAVSITSGDGDADCTLKLAASDYVDMIEGRAKGEELFFAGKLHIEGDPSLAMRLQTLNQLMS